MALATTKPFEEEDDEYLDYLIILLALWALLGGLYMLFNSTVLINLFKVGGNKRVIAQVDYKESDVRHRISDDFTWFPVEKKEIIYNQDSIFTGDESKADITFKDKTQLGLSSNTLIKLQVDAQGRPILYVMRGEIVVKPPPGKKVRVFVDGKMHEIAGVPNQAPTRLASQIHPPVSLPPPPSAPAPAVVERSPDAAVKVRSVASDEAVIKYQPPPDPEYKINTPGPYELTSKMSYIFIDGGQPYLFGEMSGQIWSHKLFDKPDPSVFRLDRWGLSFRYAQAMPGGHDEQGYKIELTRINTDLKFKLLPGLWNRDRIIGAMMCYQSFSYRNVGGDMAGLGLFWGQMVAGRWGILSDMSWWKYPKWIEAEAQYFLVSPQSYLKLNTNYNLSISGKMFLQPMFYIFSSFGYTQADYVNSERNDLRAEYGAYYGTAGVGANF